MVRILASISIIDEDDEEEGELEIPEAYNQGIKISLKSYQESVSMIQQLEEFSKEEECITGLQHMCVVTCEHEKQLTFQNNTVQRHNY
jgi:hypothetical protein